MKVLHILKSAPDGSTKKIIELHSAANQVTVIDLTTAGLSYDTLVAAVFSHDKIFCW